MRERPALFLGLLADQRDLIAEVGVLRWRASGSIGTPGPWIESTARDAGRDRLPLALVATNLDGQVIGAVTLGPEDRSPCSFCAETGAWVLQVVVRPEERRRGVGRLMMAAVEDLAREHGQERLWVAACDPDVEFYRSCGWAPAPEESHDTMLVLSKQLTVVA